MIEMHRAFDVEIREHALRLNHIGKEQRFDNASDAEAHARLLIAGGCRSARLVGMHVVFALERGRHALDPESLGTAEADLEQFVDRQ